jgi:xylulokinase
LWLTGELCTDPSDASASGFFNPGKLTWSEDILRLTKLGKGNFPEVKPSLSIGGYLRKNISSEFDLPERIPVIVGGGDQAMQALAFNVTNPGQCLVTIGSGGQVFTPTLKPIPDMDLRLNLYCHVISNLWHYEAATLSAGLSLRWLKSLLGNHISYQVWLTVPLDH